jgi:predicted metalloprotease
MRRAVCLLVLAVLLTAAGGCGSSDVNNALQGARDRAQEVGRQAERLRAQVETAGRRLARRVRTALDQLGQAVPQARDTAQAPAARGRTEAQTIDGFLTDVLRSVDAYWTTTLRKAGRPAPSVRYDWVPPGGSVPTGCGASAGPDAAFYCPDDDTIYVSQVLAAEIWRGVARNFPGERTGSGHAVGDFGLAYVVAHEYAHNIQQELGVARVDPRYGVEPLELQADCMAGLWGNSVYKRGLLQPGDVQEAISTAQAAGDFEYSNPQHHGTPAQRRQAWLIGYRSGDPARCGTVGGV